MAVAVPLDPPPLGRVPDEQRMLVNGVTWKDYVILREALDTPGLRMTFCEGTLELMSPSRSHELWKTTIARLVELYALERDLPLYGYGSTTFRNEARERGAEPDECYRVGEVMRDGELPDIALEVIYTAPLLDKLHVYSGLGVRELWLFRNAAFEVYRFADGRYDRIPASEVLADIDLDLIARFAMREDQHAALKELREILRAK